MLRKFLQFLILGRSDIVDKFDVLVEEVTALSGVVQSAIAMIENLATQIEDAKDDPEQIAALVADLRGQKKALAAAVAANSEPVVPPVIESVDQPDVDEPVE